jgi:signal peptidase I
MEDLKRRRPPLALFLSLLTPGLGQLYNGQLKKGFIIYLGGLLLLATAGFSGIFSTFKGMLMTLAVAMGFLLFAVIEAFCSAIKLKGIMCKQYNRWYFYLAIILVASFISSSIKSVVLPYKFYIIPAGSMSPTMEVGDHFVVNTKFHEKEGPNRGDIVVFRYPVDPSKDFIKRVIGLSGDVIEIKNKVVFINGQPQKEEYVKHTDSKILPPAVSPRDNTGPLVVPPHSLFTMGDNRDESYDSRFWKFVETSSLKGKALFIYWSKDRTRIGMDIK